MSISRTESDYFVSIFVHHIFFAAFFLKYLKINTKQIALVDK